MSPLKSALDVLELLSTMLLLALTIGLCAPFSAGARSRAGDYLDEPLSSLSEEQYERLRGDLEDLTNRMVMHQDISYQVAKDQARRGHQVRVSVQLPFTKHDWKVVANVPSLMAICAEELHKKDLPRSVYRTMGYLLRCSQSDRAHESLFSPEASERLHILFSELVENLSALPYSKFKNIGVEYDRITYEEAFARLLSFSTASYDYFDLSGLH